MASFFSGTDTNTLLSEGLDCNNFVSLIVNNIGEYTAAVTRKVTKKVISEETTYNFFGEGERVDAEEYTEEEVAIEWFKLKVEKENVPTFSTVADRIEEIKKSKLTPNTIKATGNKVEISSERTPKFSYNYYDDPFVTPYDGYGSSYNSYKNDFGKDAQTSIKFGTDFDADTPNKPTADPEIVESLVRQLITGSIIIPNGSKLEIEKWVKSMPSLYGNRFGRGPEGMKVFKEWIETFTDFITFNTNDRKLSMEGYNASSICTLYTEALVKRLESFQTNEYIKVIIETLKELL